MFQTAFQSNAFQNDAFQISGIEPTPPFDTHDGFTPEEIKRAKRLDKKIRKQELALLKAQRADREARKARLRELIDPESKNVAQTKQNKIQSIQEVKADIPSVDTKQIEQSIAYLENQRSQLLRAVELRRKETQLRVKLFEAKRLAELDDEESLFILLQ
jgi:hypothetical protein